MIIAVKRPMRCSLKSKPKIPDAVIKRLPRYYRYLGDLLQMGISRVSSKDLSARMGLTSSQVRQDFYNFGGFGVQGYGYDVEYLYQEIRKILGLERNFRLIIVGVGNLGTAVAKYLQVKKDGYQLLGLFDANPTIIGKEVGDLEVQDISKLSEFIQEYKIEIAALSVPARNARDTANLLVGAGIRGIWNFTPAELKLPPDVFLENVHITDCLMALGYRIASSSSD
jgi:redox-sensing transcriptional repressor